MGEEEKKQPGENKEDGAKKPKQQEKKTDEAPEEKQPSKDESKEAKKTEEADTKDNKESSSIAPQPPPPPPQEIVLKVYMHCEGCARKVRRCLKGFEGVEDVETDCKAHKVVVKGEKADPLKVLERVQRKNHRRVELLSPIPKPPSEEEPKKEAAKEIADPEAKKEEAQVITAVLKVHMHCDACAQEIRRRIQKMKGVESAEADPKSSEVVVKGCFEPPKLVDFIHKRTGKHASILKVETEKKAEENAKDTEEKKDSKDNDGEKEAKKGEEEETKGKNEGGDQAPKQDGEQDEDPKLEMRKSELFYNYHPQNYQLYHQSFIQQELNAYPPQIFSDENPNSCSVM